VFVQNLAGAVQNLAATVLIVLLPLPSWAQNSVPGGQAGTSPATAISVQQAIQMATAVVPELRAAFTDARLAREDRVQARSALLPDVSYTTGAIYTQPNGTPSGRFISANSVHEYISQGVVHEALSFTSVADYRRAGFLQAVAKAKFEVASRGLASTVVQNFYGVIAAQRKLQHTEEAEHEARHFLDLSRKLESGGEVAHSDVIKAELQANDRQRDFLQARLAAEKARLDLAVLIFRDFTRDYQLVDDLDNFPELVDFGKVQELASRNNPALAAALASLNASQEEVAAAIGGRVPSLTFSYNYGIDAPNYATRTNGIHNLGYQMAGTLNLPVFDWGGIESKVRQARSRRDLARVELSAAQREALANVQQFFSEAQEARTELDALKQSSDLANESLRLTNLRYQGGEATALEVVDAQNALVLARNNYEDGAVRYHVAVARLQTLTGKF
jgi:outer membrane protein TolC